MERLLAAVLAACLPWIADAAEPASPRPAGFGPPAVAVECPAELPATARCLGRDGAGAFHLVALPAAWNGVFVLHAHGNPTLGRRRGAVRSAQARNE